MKKSYDALVRLAEVRIVKASADLEVQLSRREDGSPALHILRELRARAAESLAALVSVDPEDPKAIRDLQNEVKRYDEWLVWMKELIAEGKSVDDKMQEEEREELFELLMLTDEGQQEAIRLGLVNPNLRDE